MIPRWLKRTGPEQLPAAPPKPRLRSLELIQYARADYRRMLAGQAYEAPLIPYEDVFEAICELDDRLRKLEQ